MFCPVCGAPAPDDAVFCGKCGANLSGSQQFAATQSQTVQQSEVLQQSAVLGQQMNHPQAVSSVQPQTGTNSNAKQTFPGHKTRKDIGGLAFAIQGFLLGVTACTAGASISDNMPYNIRAKYQSLANSERITAFVFGLIILCIEILAALSLKKTNIFHIAGDEESFKKWKTINTVMLVLECGILPVIVFLSILLDG